MRPPVLLLLTAMVFAGSTHLSRAQAHDSVAPTSPTVHPQAIGGAITSSEIALDGPITEVATKQSAGSPQGTHLLVRGSMQIVDVSVGPYLSSDITRNIVEGSQIHVTGVMQTTAKGKTYLMARQIVLNGQTIIIRNENGFLGRYRSQIPQSDSRHAGIAQVGGVN
jgi:hypothetical protein